MNLAIDIYCTIKELAELWSFLMAPLLAYFAWKMLAQIKIGAAQLGVAKTAIEIQSKREAARLAAEQANKFAEEVIPMINNFRKLQKDGKYPILSSCEIKESWPDIECKTNDFPGLMREIHSNDALVVRILNRMEGIAMFFACGIADADKAYRPLSSTFCEHVKLFLPYLIISNERNGHFSYSLALYGAWGARRHREKAEKEIS